MGTGKEGIEKLKALMERLRTPGGCPWDREQTLATLVPFIIEEAYEVVAAIDSGEAGAIKEEIGDLLFQIVFISRICEEEGFFDIHDVISNTHEKMVRRHPHVFGGAKADTSAEVLERWAEIKKGEKDARGDSSGYLSGVPESMPALLRAHKVSQKAAKTGFDWKDAAHVMEKVEEELAEFKEAVRKNDYGNMEEEIGDLLFTIVNAARFMQVNPEDALRKTIGKFIARFHYIERALKKSGSDLSTTTLEEMERLWNEAKESR